MLESVGSRKAKIGRPLSLESAALEDCSYFRSSRTACPVPDGTFDIWVRGFLQKSVTDWGDYPGKDSHDLPTQKFLSGLHDESLKKGTPPHHRV